jgi:hypothetical protein
LAAFETITVNRTNLLLALVALFCEAAMIIWLDPLAGMIIPSFGVVLNFWFVIHKVGRTGTWTTWGLLKHESTELERKPQFVGLTLVFGSIVLLWSLTRTAPGG